MATVTSDKVDAGIPAREPHSGVCSVKASFTVPTTGDGSAANDVIQMVKVPDGATVLEVIFTSEDLDTNATPTIVFDVGDGGDADRYIDGTTIGQTGGVIRLGSGVAAATADALFHTYTADDTIDVTVTAAAATAAEGVITLTVLYTMED